MNFLLLAAIAKVIIWTCRVRAQMYKGTQSLSVDDLIKLGSITARARVAQVSMPLGLSSVVLPNCPRGELSFRPKKLRSHETCSSHAKHHAEVQASLKIPEAQFRKEQFLSAAPALELFGARRREGESVLSPAELKRAVRLLDEFGFAVIYGAVDTSICAEMKKVVVQAVRLP